MREPIPQPRKLPAKPDFKKSDRFSPDKPTEIEQCYEALWKIAIALDAAYAGLQQLEKLTARRKKLQDRF